MAERPAQRQRGPPQLPAGVGQPASVGLSAASGSTISSSGRAPCRTDCLGLPLGERHGAGPSPAQTPRRSGLGGKSKLTFRHHHR